MIRLALIAPMLFALATPAGATQLFAAAGAWTGEGRIATGPDAGLERGRCQVEIVAAASGDDVSITGRCAVAAGISDISLRLVRGQGGKVNAGVWSAATGQTVQFAGTETTETITLAAIAPVVLGETVYETRVEVLAPGAEGFTLRQTLRADGETAWRLVVDIAYRPGGG